METGRLMDINLFELVFVDSNILTYHLLEDPMYGESCRKFIGRIETGEINGFISTLVMSETIFNFIKASILLRHNLKADHVINFLKKHPDVIKEVELEYPRSLFSIFKILPITESMIEVSYDLIPEHSLLPNDAIHLATMRTYGIKNLASNDRDFENLGWMKLYKPSKE